jgi:3-dehydroquinate synthase
MTGVRPQVVERVVLAGAVTEVRTGLGLRETLGGALREAFPRAERIGLVVDERVAALWPLGDLGRGREVVSAIAPAGEAAKTRAVHAALEDRLLELRREEPVVAVGGGAVLDVAGFAAATVRRGLPWVAVPTTVVAMADAAVGGKVAVNHPRGKNLLGTFHPPRLVLSDPAFLTTLPPRDRVAGLAEVYKAARVGDGELLALLRAAEPEALPTVSVLARAVAVKARLVEADEQDRGPRRALNYGHTAGHALETRLGPERIRHGEAVAIGMGVAAALALARGLLGGEEVAAQDADLGRLGLPVRLPEGVAPEGLLAALAEDKKRRPGETHVFVLPTGAHGVVVAEDVTEAEVQRALAARASGPPRSART